MGLGPSSAGGKGQNQGYGYANNMNRNGVKNLSKNAKNKKNNLNTGINKRLASPQIYPNANGIGYNGNNQSNNNINKNKIGRFNQRPSSAGGKSQNQGYGYVNNMNRSGNKFNKNLKTKKSNNISTGINKRLASPQMFNNANGIGFNGNNQNNLKNKFNPAKNRMPSPVVKSNRIY